MKRIFGINAHNCALWVGSPKEKLFDEFMNNWRGIVPFTIKAQQQNSTP
ncbi:2750_t:CDS:2 [Entrophospora sp. SA101]|nr:2750_t:CDS:2 [Entrophospora sp. SA101]